MFRRWLILCLCLPAGCVFGGQTGDEGEHDRGEFSADEVSADAGSQCEDAETIEVGLDDETPLGVTPRAVLELAEGAQESPLSWTDRSPFPYGPEQGESTITLSVTAAGDARVVESQPRGDIEGEIFIDCPARVEVDVEVVLTTGGGALDERFTTTLKATSPNLARLQHALDPDALGGSLAFELPDDRDVRVHMLSVSASFTRYGGSGQLVVGFEETSSDAVSDFAVPPLATWPDDAECFETVGGVPVPYDVEDEPTSGRAAVEAINALSGLTLATDAGEVPLTLSLTHDGGAVCVELDTSFGQPASGALDLGGTLTLDSEDGGVAATLTVRVRAMPDANGELSAVEVRLSHMDPCGEWGSETPFADRCAGLDVDASSYDGAHLELMLEVDLASAEARVSGALTVLGEVVPDCVTSPPPPERSEDGSISTPGCEGISAETIARMSIGG